MSEVETRLAPSDGPVLPRTVCHFRLPAFVVQDTLELMLRALGAFLRNHLWSVIDIAFAS